jgi:hypothetical protein
MRGADHSNPSILPNRLPLPGASQANGTCGIQTVGNLGKAESSMKSIGVPAPKHRNFIGGLQLRQVSAFQLKE